MTAPIEALTEKIIGARGLDYIAGYRKLKAYLDEIGDDEFKEQLARTSNPDIFRYLLSAGLSWERQEWVAERWERLTK